MLKHLHILNLALCLLAACKDDTTDPPKPVTIQLAFEDASCTEAWLKVSLTDANEPRTVAIKRDGQTVLTSRLTANDTTLVDTNLLPKRSYNYQAVRLNNNSPVDTSPTLPVTTIDTTSHNFTWQIDTLGVTSSTLYDVAIINDTLAYAVGEIFLRDSSGQLDPILYNLAKWNGHNWEIKRILSDCRLYYPNCGPVFFTPSPGKAVFAFAPNDVWIVAGGVHHFDGTNWTEQRAIVEIGGTNKMWGSTSRDLWFVGNSGFIIHYNGSTWRRVESGTTLPINDVWGGMNSFRRSTEVIAVASLFQFNQGVKLLSISPSGARELSSRGIPWRMRALWFLPERRYYVVGDGLMVKRSIEDTTTWENLAPRVTQHFMEEVTGNGLNDVVVVGHFGNLLHFNGMSWRSFQGQTPSSVLFLAVAMKGNMFFAVGLSQGRGIVLRGYRR